MFCVSCSWPGICAAQVKKAEAHGGEQADAEITPEVVRQRTIAVISWTIGFFVAIWLLGFSIAVPLMILLYLKIAGKESWLMTAQVTFFSWLFYWGLFEKLLNVPFPEGLLIGLFKGGRSMREGAFMNRLYPINRFTHHCANAKPRQTFSGVSGKSYMRNPVARKTALPIAAATGNKPPSPVPLAPNGPGPL